MRAIASAFALPALLVGAWSSWAQPTPAPTHVGFLSMQSAANPGARAEAFLGALRELGYIDGRNIVIDSRWAELRPERLPALARELSAGNVAVIVALEPPGVQAASAATKTIPIVMRATDDPVSQGLADSLARPGGNITGVMSESDELQAKRLELLRELMPGASDVIVFWTGEGSKQVEVLRRTAPLLGVRLRFLAVHDTRDIEAAFRGGATAGAGGLTVVRTPLVVNNRRLIAELAKGARLPSVFDEREYAEAGGLVSYGANLTELYRRAATYVDRILKGAKPAELPIEQPTKFELVVNLKTAKALGITIPQSILLRADEVIE